MAGDWIKMRTDLQLDPSVIAIASAVGIDEDHVVGKLHRLWSWADQHTFDGNASSVTEKWIDRFTNCAGFASAMRDTGWLILTEGGVQFPKFYRHNGQTGKQRALTAKRVAALRNANCNADVTQGALARGEKEKRRRKTPKSPEGDLCLELPEGLNTPEIKEAWEAWIRHRQEAKSSATKVSQERTIKKLLKMGPERALAALDHSISNNWLGIYEPDSSRNSAREKPKKPWPDTNGKFKFDDKGNLIKVFE